MAAKRIIKRKTRKTITALLFVLPCLLGAFVLYVIPMLISFVYSFTQGVGQLTFVGFDNYIQLLSQNGAFLLSLKNTALFSIMGIPLLIIISLFLATLLNTGVSKMTFFRSAMLYPMIIPGASVVMVWQLFLNDDGIINGFLNKFGIEPISFLNSSYSIYIIVIIFIWKNLGYNVILFMTGLNAIPPEYREAAQLDGASKIRTFFQITLPLLKPTTFFVLLMSIINSLKIFREIYQMSGGYPNDNIYFVQHFMNNNFENLNYSRLCTAAVILSLIFSVIMFFVFRLEKKSTELG
ncbi:MAG TPA: sugar ABC transporter permease [Firmicutes bacterium]|nr:sugar ABC transporter permease [Bacillota bacterium]